MNLPNTPEGAAAQTAFEEVLEEIFIEQDDEFGESGEYEQWKTLGGRGLSIPENMTGRVDVYAGPDGKGYVVTIDVLLGETVYSRSSNVGPETHRESDGWFVPQGES